MPKNLLLLRQCSRHENKEKIHTPNPRHEKNIIIFQYSGPSASLKQRWNFSSILPSSAQGPCRTLGMPLSRLSFTELILLSVPGSLGTPSPSSPDDSDASVSSMRL